MSPRILRVLLLLWLACAPGLAQARVANATIARIHTDLATLEQVRVRLDWPDDAGEGRLSLQVGTLDAPTLGYRFRALDWHCPLQRDGEGAWRCEGPLRAGDGTTMRLAVDLGTAHTDLRLQRGDTRLEVHRLAATPDLTRIDLVRVPMALTQALLARAWPEATLKAGTLDGRLTVAAPPGRPLRIDGPLRVAGLGLETRDASIAAEGLGADLRLDYRIDGPVQRIGVDGHLLGGEWLAGNTYVSLPKTPVRLGIDAIGDGQGWRLPRILWQDGGSLSMQGAAELAPDGGLRALSVDAGSEDLSPIVGRYLSGWLGAFGLGDLRMQGTLRTRLQVDARGVQGFEATFAKLDLADANGRFRFDGLDGALRFSGGAPVDSALSWRAGQLYGLDFGASELPLRSAGGGIGLRAPIAIPAVGGQIRFDHFDLRPPSGADGLRANFGLGLDALDIGVLARKLGWPAFRGTLSGTIPDARYLDDRLVFEGGLEMRMFDGRVQVSSLAMERPFGVAPSLSADLEIDDLDLLAVTEVFDFGSISGRLDGRIAGLRLIDWNATAFDAQLRTQARRGVRQRISQRAVQSISSVGDASFITSLQGRLIGYFDDFGYRRIGVSCRLHNEVCTMGGLEASGSGSDSGGFTIVQGAGIPRLDVVGFNRQVDWPTLVERLAAVGKGELSPVVE